MDATDLIGMHGDGRMNPRDRVTLRFMSSPADATVSGRSVAAGSVMEWIDKAGYACAVGWSGRYCVTAYVGSVHHRRPIGLGSLIEVEARIVHSGRASMHVMVTVSAATVAEGEYATATTCILVFVAKAEGGGSTAVPTWKPGSASDRAVAAAAAARVAPRAQIKKLLLEEGQRSPSDCPETEMRFLVPPGVANWGGKAHGGTVMRWIDEAAYACAVGWAGGGDGSSEALAVHSGGLHFLAPIHIGHTVEVLARLVHTTRHGMHMIVRVSSFDPRRPDDVSLTTVCTTTFVVVDDGGRALEVPQWKPQTPEDRLQQDRAKSIIALRRSLPVMDAPPSP